MKEIIPEIKNYAKDRTLLANERTFLSYLRTSLAFIIAGAFILKIDQSYANIYVSLIPIALGVGIFFYGTHRMIQIKEKLTSNNSHKFLFRV